LSDPGQRKNVAGEQPEILAALSDYYEKWWSRNEPLAREFQPIHIGSDHENPVFLGSEDWLHWGPGNMFGIRQGTNPQGPPWNGPWNILVEREGEYEISLRRWPSEADAAITAGVPAFKGELISMKEGRALPIVKARLSIGGFEGSKPVAAGDKAAVFNVHLAPGRTRLQSWFYDEAGKELCGAFFVYVRRIS
jgi:arylsulfatase